MHLTPFSECKIRAKAVISKAKGKKMEGSLIFSHITVCTFLEATGARCNPSTVCAVFKHKALIPAQTQSSPPSCRVCARMRTCDCMIRCFGGTEHTGFGLPPQCKSIRCSRHVLMEVFELEDQWIYRVWKLTDSCYVWFKDGINIHLKTHFFHYKDAEMALSFLNKMSSRNTGFSTTHTNNGWQNASISQCVKHGI